MANFDERSGLISCSTPWGSWGQTIDEVFVEVNVAKGTRGRDVRCKITAKDIDLCVRDQQVLKGQLFESVVTDDCVWTLEDGVLIRIILIKSGREAGKCWKSLLVGQYQCDPVVFDQMEKKLTLERFQKENPGFDFSGADITGNYHKGGPQNLS